MFGLITLPLVINYGSLGWVKKLESSKCWWGQCVLVLRAIFRIRGNENQPGLQLVGKLATPLSLPLLSDCITFSSSSPLQADEVNFLNSTLCSCSTTWRGSKVCNQKEIFLTVLNTLKKRVFDCGRSCLVPVPKPHYSARALCVSCHVVRASSFWPRRPGKTPYRD